VVELFPATARTAPIRTAMAVASLVLFFFVHAAGVRWFGRRPGRRWSPCLGLSVAVLVLPASSRSTPRTTGVLHARRRRFRGRAAAAVLPLRRLRIARPERRGEVKDSRRRLPGIFLRGLLATAVVYVLMSAVAFGALPGERLQSVPLP
jgi:amino acid transporter